MPRLPRIIDQENGHRVENTNFILDIGNGKVEELTSYNQLYFKTSKIPKTMTWVLIKNFSSSDPSLDTKVLLLHQIKTEKAT